MRRFIFILFLFGLIAQPQFCYADDYKVSVTRRDSNLYKVTGKDIYIHTRYCYEYVYYEDAILKMNGYTGEIIFLEEGEKCDVRAVFGPAEIEPGTYKVTISRESDNWYEIFGTDIFIKTSMCLSLALGEEVILKLSAGGIGNLYFSDGDECMVEGVYAHLKL